MAKHSPAPWTARTAFASTPTTHIRSKRGHIASVRGANHAADARLMTAAPELLAALKSLLPYAEGSESFATEVVAARAAIAQAEGDDHG